MYEKLRAIELAFSPEIFGLAVAVLLDEGIKTISNLTDNEIENLKGGSLIPDDLWQTIIKVARSIAIVIKEDPTVLVSYCQDNNFFSPIKPTGFEEEEFAKIVWTHRDIIELYKQKTGEIPTENDVYEILNHINIDSDGGLEDCSYGWGIIENAIDEFLEDK